MTFRRNKRNVSTCAKPPRKIGNIYFTDIVKNPWWPLQILGTLIASYYGAHHESESSSKNETPPQTTTEVTKTPQSGIGIKRYLLFRSIEYGGRSLKRLSNYLLHRFISEDDDQIQAHPINMESLFSRLSNPVVLCATGLGMATSFILVYSWQNVQEELRRHGGYTHISRETSVH